MIDFILKIPPLIPAMDLPELLEARPEGLIHYAGPDQELMLWGDPVNGSEFVKNIHGELTPEQILKDIYGHYYFVLLNRNDGEIIAGNSLFSILPMYYHDSSNGVVFSNNATELGKRLGTGVVSRRFLLETVLFNYPLFNNSIEEKVSLLPSNTYMKIRRGTPSLVKHTFFENYFSTDPVPWRKASGSLSDSFIETVKRYLPAGRYINALTGGFDSRTLLAAGLASGGDMICYSFGAPGSKDVEIPDRVTKATGLPYVKMLLDDEYAATKSLVNGLEFVFSSSGTASFARGHYLYAVKEMARYSEYMITGNFGSELFRAANVRGVVFSPNLTALFGSENPDEAFRIIENSRQFSSLKRESFTAEWDQLRDDLLTLPCFREEYRHLTQNQKFYLFVFEEVFRKYFGAEMAGQFRYLRNRTPYIDPRFFRAILGTGFAGVYSDFFERNPFKRYKGQVLYAHILRNARPELGRIVTDKGYCPEDLLTFFGRANVLRGWIKKKINKTHAQPDPYSVDRAFMYNEGFYRKVPVDFGIFNPAFFTDEAFARPDGHFIMMLSLSMAAAVVEGKEIPALPGLQN